jgi:hypothetical protein
MSDLLQRLRVEGFAVSAAVAYEAANEIDRLTRERDNWQEEARLQVTNRDYWKTQYAQKQVELAEARVIINRLTRDLSNSDYDLNRAITKAEELAVERSRTRQHPALAGRIGVGDGSLYDAITSLDGALAEARGLLAEARPVTVALLEVAKDAAAYLPPYAPVDMQKANSAVSALDAWAGRTDAFLTKGEKP